MQICWSVTTSALGVLLLVVSSTAFPNPIPDAAGPEARASAEADPGGSFFDTFLSFFSSNTPTDERGVADQADQASSDSAVRDAGLGDIAVDDQSPGSVDTNGERVKRTGQIPSSLLNGILGHKLTYLTKGSHHVHFHNYGHVKMTKRQAPPPPPPPPPSQPPSPGSSPATPDDQCDKPVFSLWEFKKAILAKLLDAAKAIGGGVLAIKGKLLTAKGNLVAAKGRKIADKGVALTEFGKGLITKVIAGEHHVASVPSAPSAPSAPQYLPPATHAHYTAPQYLPPAPVQHTGYPVGGSGYGYGEAVSLLNEYNSGYGAVAHRVGQAPTGPSATGPAGTLPGSLQAGLLVLQPAPHQQHKNSAMAASSVVQQMAVAPSEPHQVSLFPNRDQERDQLLQAQAQKASQHPLVLAPEYMEAMSAAQQIADAAMAASQVSRRYVRHPLAGAQHRTLDDAMATVVKTLHGSDLLLNPSLIRAAASRIVRKIYHQHLEIMPFK